MPLEGSVFLALWNDFDPARDAEYERWHTFEHVPERVSVPGMLRGRRYRAAERQQDRFFTLYEVVDGSVLTSAPYLDLVHHPTDWSRDMRPSFRNVSRMPCETLVTVGQGIGGHAATARVQLDGPPGQAEIDRCRRAALATGESLPAVAVHIGRTIEQLSSYPVFAETQAGSVRDLGPSLALVAEGADRASAVEAIRRIAGAIDGAQVSVVLAYDLTFSVHQSELVRTPTGRFAPRPDLEVPIA